MYAFTYEHVQRPTGAYVHKRRSGASRDALSCPANAGRQPRDPSGVAAITTTTRSEFYKWINEVLTLDHKLKIQWHW